MTSPARAACARCATPLEQGDLRCCICGLTAPAEVSREARAVVKILRCTECGAAVAYSAEAGAPRCAFCAAVMKIEEPVDPIEQADLILPFRVSPEQAHGLLRAWLGSLGFFRPSDLASTSALESLKGIWWAGWIVDAEALVSFAADSNAGARSSAWAPHAGQTQLSFQSLLVSASRGLSLDETFRLTPHYDLSTAAPQPRAPVAGVLLEQFEAQRSAARRTLVDAIRATAAARLQQGYIPGSSFRHVHVAVVLHAFTTRRAGLPSYILAYRYRDKVYRAIVHGQDARCVFGEAPYSVGKILLVIVLTIVGIAMLIGLIALLSQR